ncbi:MAG: hypothetical protein ABI884_12840 [Gemmatimonadota bacterium]
MSHASADVQRAVGIHSHLARDITTILNGQQGRRKEWRFALASVRVAGEHPATEVRPRLLIGGIGIVHEHDGRVALSCPKRCDRISAMGPEVFHADEIQTTHGSRLASQHAHPRALRLGRDAVGDSEVSPAAPVVVVAEYAQRGEAAMRQVREDAPELRKLSLPARATVCEEVAGDDYEVRR